MNSHIHPLMASTLNDFARIFGAPEPEEKPAPTLPNSGYTLTHEEAEAVVEEATRNYPRENTGD